MIPRTSAPLAQELKADFRCQRYQTKFLGPAKHPGDIRRSETIDGWEPICMLNLTKSAL